MMVIQNLSTDNSSHVNAGKQTLHRALSLLFIICFTVTTAIAQRYTVKGTVIDKDIAEPLMGATVQLIDGSGAMVTGMTAEEDGGFSLPVTTRGKHSIKISFIGYITKTIELDTKSVKNKELNLGYVTMQADSKLLDEAMVTGAAAKVQVSGDSIVFNPSAYRIPQGSTLEALVKLLPGAQVDDSGNITINGKTVNKILVDGKEFFLNDKEMAMKNIPVDMVDRIKSYERKSDLARVTGIDDGEEETVLDLTVKKGMNNGWFGNVTAGAGTEHRYNGRAMVNRFTDNLQASLVTNARNVRDGWGWRRAQGLNSYKEVGANYATDSKYLETGGSVTYRYNGTDSWSLGNSEQFNAKNGRFRINENQSYGSNNNFNTQFRFEWKPNEKTNIILRPNATYQRNYGSSWSDSYQYEQDPEIYDNEDDRLANTFLQNYTRNQSYSENTSVGGELQANLKFNDRGRNLTLRVTGNYSDGKSQSIMANRADYLSSGFVRTNNTFNTTPTGSHNLNGQITYSEPIAERTYLQFSYQYGYSYSKNDRQAEVYDDNAYQSLYNAIRDNRYDIESILDKMDALGYARHRNERADSLSQFSEYRNYTQTIGIQFRRTRDQYNLNLGVDLIPQSTKLNYRYLGMDYPDVSRSVFNWAPRMHLRWNFNKHTDLQFRYNGRSSQPSMTNLLDIYDDSNTTNATLGNTKLDPSFSHNFRGNYHTYNAETQSSLFLFLNGSATQNAIKNLTAYVNTGGQITRPINVNGDWNAGIGAGFNTALGERKFYTVGGMIRTNYSHDVGYFTNLTEKNRYAIENAEITRSLTKNFTLGGDVRAAYRNDFFNIELMGGANWTNGRNNVNTMANKDNYDFNYGGRFEWTSPWGVELSTDLNMQSRRGYAREDMNTDEMVWNAALSYSFLRGRVLTIRAEAFDILGQQSNISRVINSFQVSDTRVNAVNQYAMLTLTYRFSVFGGRNAVGTGNDRQEQMWGFPGGGGGRGGRPAGAPPAGARPPMRR